MEPGLPKFQSRSSPPLNCGWKRLAFTSDSRKSLRSLRDACRHSYGASTNGAVYFVDCLGVDFLDFVCFDAIKTTLPCRLCQVRGWATGEHRHENCPSDPVQQARPGTKEQAHRELWATVTESKKNINNNINQYYVRMNELWNQRHPFFESEHNLWCSNHSLEIWV